MDNIQDLVAEIESTERGLLARRSVETQSTTRNTLLTIAFGNILAFSILALAGLVVRRNLRELKQAESNVRDANEKLTQSLLELEQRNRENLLLGELADLFQACNDTAEAYEIVARFGKKLFPRQGGALYMFRSSQNTVNCVASWGDSLASESSFSPEECWALRLGRPHIAGKSELATLCGHIKTGCRIWNACIPLQAQGTGLGILYLQTAQDCPDAEATAAPEFLTPSEKQLAFTAAEQIGLSLANLNLREALRVQSIHDALTGLFNRRYMEESLERDLFKMARKNRAVGFIMLDIDHFKRFNDTFGHEAGDTLLRAFGEFLTDHMRKEDIACRYGGEEFTLVLSEASLKDTVKRAEQLREEAKRVVALHHGKTLGPVTISLGVAAHPDHGATVAELTAAADAALYRAKSEGRDRVVVAEPVKLPIVGHEQS